MHHHNGLTGQIINAYKAENTHKQGDYEFTRGQLDWMHADTITEHLEGSCERQPWSFFLEDRVQA